MMFDTGDEKLDLLLRNTWVDAYKEAFWKGYEKGVREAYKKNIQKMYEVWDMFDNGATVEEVVNEKYIKEENAKMIKDLLDKLRE